MDRGNQKANDFKIIELQVLVTTPDGIPPSHGHQQIPCHMIFDVRFDERKKPRFESGGHRTNDPIKDAYSGVVVHNIS